MERRYFNQFSPDQGVRHPRSVGVTREEFVRLVEVLKFSDQPIHVDAEYAKEQGFNDIILPGPIVYALVFQLTRRELSWYGINLGTDNMRHLLPVYPGDILHASSTVTRVDKWDGKRAETHGLVVVDTIGMNQNYDTVIEFERSILVQKKLSRKARRKAPSS